MSGTTLAHALYRVHPDGTTELVSEHPDFGEGWSAGTAAAHADRDHAYALHRGRTRVASFAHARARSRKPESNLLYDNFDTRRPQDTIPPPLAQWISDKRLV